jgi:hypothetical protein
MGFCAAPRGGGLKVSTELAVSDALLATLRTALGANVWTRPPDNAVPPYTVIGEFNSTPLDAKDCGAEWHDVEIIDWAQGETRAAVQARMVATKLALFGTKLARVTITFAGLAPFKADWLSGIDELHEDGVTWSGTQHFKILGQAAG